MLFRQALTTVLQTDSRQQTVDAFYLYSRISDLCASSYEDTRKNKLFFEVNKRLNVVHNLFQDGKLAIPILKLAYPAVKHLLIHSSFIKLIDCVAQATEVVDLSIQKSTPSAQMSAKKAQSAPKNTSKTPRPLQKAPTAFQSHPEETTSKVGRVTPQKACGNNAIVAKSSPKWWIAASVVAIVAIAITLLVVFRFQITWTGWQHVIGLFGGAFLLGLVGIVTYILDEEVVLDFYVLGTILLGIIGLANWLLDMLLGGNYKIIFVWLSVYELIGGVLLALFTFDDSEKGWGWAQIFVLTAIIAGLVVGLVFSGAWLRSAL